MFAETYRGDRPEPFNSCILQAWSAGMYAWAFTELVLGLRLDLVNKEIQINPQIPEELGSSIAAPIRVNFPIQSRAGNSLLSATIDPVSKKLTASFRGKQPPKISSANYSVTVV